MPALIVYFLVLLLTFKPLRSESRWNNMSTYGDTYQWNIWCECNQTSLAPSWVLSGPSCEELGCPVWKCLDRQQRNEDWSFLIGFFPYSYSFSRCFVSSKSFKNLGKHNELQGLLHHTRKKPPLSRSSAVVPHSWPASWFLPQIPWVVGEPSGRGVVGQRWQWVKTEWYLFGEWEDPLTW